MKQTELKREEQIREAAYSRYCNDSSVTFGLQCDCFVDGAKWANKKTVEKACKWLEKHVEDFMPPTNSLHDYNTGELIHFFKKAMEE